ncbi:NXPE family member 4-like [Ruditapes philippinarum]|uniref:NXPE family member 4-like n=1 Tax=Ruditapes philippinarum TaxID=129788 RepID=UPI00295B65A6|nr:NXPE family member 4-like [Ruditapes philippinarum]
MTAPGIVFDNTNGSYLIIFECFWSGPSQIIVSIAYTQEAVSALFKLMTKVLAMVNIEARYERGNETEDLFCHPDIDRLKIHTHYKEICNFTSLNSGLPWFCGKPKRKTLECKDWKYSRHTYQDNTILLNQCEKDVLKRSHQRLEQTINVSIQEAKQTTERLSCFKYNITNLWFLKQTTGYLQNTTWHTTHCKGLIGKKLGRCIRNKTLYLFGDSTVRQWYSAIKRRINCKQFTKKMTYPISKLTKAGCTATNNNFTMFLAPHSYPFYISKNHWKYALDYLTSISRRIDQISPFEDAVVLIHVFAHMKTFHYKNFRKTISHIRHAIERLLERNKHVKIFIKMPHTFTENIAGLNDFFGWQFSKIIFETFDGLFDEVIPLDQKDATIAAMSKFLHPPNFIVEAMVNQMFSYVCE